MKATGKENAAPRRVGPCGWEKPHESGFGDKLGALWWWVCGNGPSNMRWALLRLNEPLDNTPNRCPGCGDQLATEGRRPRLSEEPNKGTERHDSWATCAACVGVPRDGAAPCRRVADWESDSTELAHMLRAAERDGLASIPSADALASRILKSHWLHAVKEHARTEQSAAVGL